MAVGGARGTGEAGAVEAPTWSGGRWVAVVGGCTVVAVLALALPATLSYDAWAWLVWGREIVRFDLDTTGGPSWKPLPVLVAVPVSTLGDLAPAAWLVVARVGGLLALVGVYRLASRLAGRTAGAIAAALLVLAPDAQPRYLRLVLEGHSAPVTATLAVWAVERHMAGRYATTAVLLTLLALDRPEAWPFLGVYALWLAWREPARRPALAALLAAVPLLWFGADWWGSGSPLHGASAAQVFASRDDRYGMAIGWVLQVVVAPAWVLAIAGAVVLWRRGRRDVATLLGLALAWMGLVVAMSALQGYAALPRFQLPGAALVCVGAAVAAVVGARALPPGTRRTVTLAAVVLVAAPFVVLRALAIRPVAEDVVHRGRADRELAAALDDAGGPDRLQACRPLMISSLPPPSVAWRADVPLHDVVAVGTAPAGVVVVAAGGPAERRLAAADPGAVPLAQRGRWVVYDVGCDRERGG